MNGPDGTAAGEVPAAVLVDRIAAGDKRAEAELVRRFSRSMLTMLEMRAGDRATAEDIHQETFCIVLERLRTRGIDNPGLISAFIHRTALNILIGEYRKDARRKTDVDTALVERCSDSRSDQLQALIREESDRAVRLAIQELKNPRDKELLYRFYILQEEKAAICTTLRLSTAHFDRVISRARQRFRRFVEMRQPCLLAPDGLT